MTFLTITCFINFSYVLQCSFLFRVYMLTRYSIRLYSDLGAHVLIVLFVFIYVYRGQTWFPYQTYVSYTIAMIGATRWTGTAYWSETHTFTPVVLWSWYYIRLPPLFSRVCITYVYLRCFMQFVLHMFTPVDLWSLYYICLPPLFCRVCITCVYLRCFVEFVLHMFTPVVL